MNMNQMIPWNPLAQLASLTRTWPTTHASEFAQLPDWMPSVDISEEDKAYLIKFDLPEVRKDDIEVELEGTVLTVRGTRKAEKEEKSRKVHRVERVYGAFSRSFELPDDIQAGSVAATLKDGVLTVEVAKAEQVQPKRVPIKVS